MRTLLALAAGYATARAIEARVRKLPIMSTVRYPFTSVATLAARRDAIAAAQAQAAAAAQAPPVAAPVSGAYFGAGAGHMWQSIPN